MNRKFTILVDMDDTIEDLGRAWTEFLNKKHGTNVRRDDIREWDMTKAFPTIKREDVYAPLFDEEMWKTVKPIKNAAEMLEKLISDGHEVFIVTTSHYKTLKIKLENVLFKYFPFLTYDDVIITSKKQMIHGDFLVDDGIHNLEGGFYNKILFDAPHNRSVDEKKYGAERAKSWDDVYQIICRCAEEKKRRRT